MSRLATLFPLLLLLSPAALADDPPSSFFQLPAKDLDGKPADLEQYKGKVVLVVNVASKCGFTSQYAGLEKLQAELAPRGFTILAFPCNDFGGQEPGSPVEIRTFCSERYKVSFPLFEKCQTKAGEGQSPVYAFLERTTHQLPSWNFCKYVIGRDGKPVAYFPSKIAPESDALRQALEKALAAPAGEKAKGERDDDDDKGEDHDDDDDDDKDD